MTNVSSIAQPDNQGLIAALKLEICQTLSLDLNSPPVSVNDKQAAEVLGVKASTLGHWRSVGRYDLQYMKVGRLVRYRLDDLAAFLANRTCTHTGENQGG